MTKIRQQFDPISVRYKAVVAEFLRLQTTQGADSDEVFQEVWLDFFRCLDRGLPRYPQAYLLQIARRKVGRSFAAQRTIELQDVDAIAAPGTNREIASIVAQALNDLDPEKREVFLMKHKLGLSYDEIAKVLEIPSGTVASRLHRAINDLKADLGKAGFNTRIGERA